MPAGRRPGRSLSESELRHLRLLLDLRTRAYAAGREWDIQIEETVLRLREDGASVRGIAKALNVGASTVQGWTENARRRRDGD